MAYDEMLRKNRQLPWTLRLLEGGSTNMLLGYLYAGGGITSPLSLVYMMHWMASLHNHLFPSYDSFLLDTHLIDMVMMERLVYIFSYTWIYGLFLLFLLTNSNHIHPFVCFLKAMMAVLWIHLACHPSREYSLSFIGTAFFYMLSDWAFSRSRQYLKVGSHVCFHLCATYGAYEETKLYTDMEQQTFHGIRSVMYMIYVWKGLQWRMRMED